MDKKVLATVAVISLVSAFPAVAAERFSLSAGITRSTVDTAMPIGGANPALPPPTLGSDFSGTGFRISGTYPLVDWLGVEAGWARFGEEDGRTSHFGGPIGICPPNCEPTEWSIDRIDQSGSAFWLAAAPSYRTGDWVLSGKLGISRSEAKSARIGTDERVRVTDSAVMFGIAATYWFGERIGVRADLDRFGSHANQFGLSVAVRF